MPSSPTTRNRLEKMAAGERLNTWGEPGLNNDFDLIDIALDGWMHKALTADAVLSSVNYSADESRPRCLKFTGTGAFTVTIPSLEKWYYIWNACTGALTITTGAGGTASIAAGEIAPIICDASNVKKVKVINYGTDTVSGGTPTAAAHFTTKAYVDALAFAATNLPGQGVGTVNQYVRSNGASASWVTIPVADVDGAAPLAAPAFTGNGSIAGDWAVGDDLTVAGTATIGDGLSLTGGTVSSVTAVAAVDLDFSDNDCQTKTISVNTAFTISGLQPGKAQFLLFVLTITDDAEPSFPAWVGFDGGVDFLADLGNGEHWLSISTINGGTSGLIKTVARSVA